MLKKILAKIHSYRYKKLVSSGSVEDRFSNIYKNNLWFKNRESRSGAGSTLLATKAVRQELPALLTELNASSLLDVGCGDFHWMKEVKLPCPYLGIDVVKELIDENRARFSSGKIDFMHLDATQQPLPSRDVVLCREVIFHLSFNDGLSLLNNIVLSNAQFLIATTNDDVLQNKDIITGYFRNINLQLPPYSLPDRMKLLTDEAVSDGRILAVWDLQSVRNLKKESVA